MEVSLVDTTAGGLEWDRTGTGMETLATGSFRFRKIGEPRQREVVLMTVTAVRPERSAPFIQTLPLYRTGRA